MACLGISKRFRWLKGDVTTGMQVDLEREARLAYIGPQRPLQAAGFHTQNKGKTLQDINQAAA